MDIQNQGSIKLFLDGKEIGETHSIDGSRVYNEVAQENINAAIQARSFSGAIVTANFSLVGRNLINQLGEQLPSFDIAIVNRGMPARCHRMTKNRRIRKKWFKKYGPPTRESYKNCTITGYREDSDSWQTVK